MAHLHLPQNSPRNSGDHGCLSISWVDLSHHRQSGYDNHLSALVLKPLQTQNPLHPKTSIQSAQSGHRHQTAHPKRQVEFDPLRIWAVPQKPILPTG